MTDSARLLLMLALAGAVVTFMGSLLLWVRDPARMMHRALRRVLGEAPDGLLLSPAHERCAGIAVDKGKIAVCWDTGKWCLVYRLEELAGAELRIDGQVVGRALRGEASRMLDHTSGAGESVVLRLIFDDPRYPDFDIELWARGDSLRRVAPTPAEAIMEGNSWLARAEAILRRPRAASAQAAAPSAAPNVATPPPMADEPENYEDAEFEDDDVVDPEAPIELPPLPPRARSVAKPPAKKEPGDDDPELPF